MRSATPVQVDDYYYHAVYKARLPWNPSFEVISITPRDCQVYVDVHHHRDAVHSGTHDHGIARTGQLVAPSADCITEISKTVLTNRPQRNPRGLFCCAEKLIGGFCRAGGGGIPGPGPYPAVRGRESATGPSAGPPGWPIPASGAPRDFPAPCWSSSAACGCR